MTQHLARRAPHPSAQSTHPTTASFLNTHGVIPAKAGTSVHMKRRASGMDHSPFSLHNRGSRFRGNDPVGGAIIKSSWQWPVVVSSANCPDAHDLALDRRPHILPPQSNHPTTTSFPPPPRRHSRESGNLRSHETKRIKGGSPSPFCLHNRGSRFRGNDPVGRTSIESSWQWPVVVSSANCPAPP